MVVWAPSRSNSGLDPLAEDLLVEKRSRYRGGSTPLSLHTLETAGLGTCSRPAGASYAGPFFPHLEADFLVSSGRAEAGGDGLYRPGRGRDSRLTKSFSTSALTSSSPPPRTYQEAAVGRFPQGGLVLCPALAWSILWALRVCPHLLRQPLLLHLLVPKLIFTIHPSILPSCHHPFHPIPYHQLPGTLVCQLLLLLGLFEFFYLFWDLLFVQTLLHATFLSHAPFQVSPLVFSEYEFYLPLLPRLVVVAGCTDSKVQVALSRKMTISANCVKPWCLSLLLQLFSLQLLLHYNTSFPFHRI